MPVDEFMKKPAALSIALVGERFGPREAWFSPDKVYADIIYFHLLEDKRDEIPHSALIVATVGDWNCETEIFVFFSQWLERTIGLHCVLKAPGDPCDFIVGFSDRMERKTEVEKAILSDVKDPLDCRNNQLREVSVCGKVDLPHPVVSHKDLTYLKKVIPQERLSPRDHHPVEVGDVSGYFFIFIQGEFIIRGIFCIVAHAAAEIASCGHGENYLFGIILDYGSVCEACGVDQTHGIPPNPQ